MPAMQDDATNTGHGECLSKSMLPAAFDPLASVSRDVGGGMHWPIAPTALLLLYLGSPEHARCIHLIAEGAFGGGLVDQDGQPIQTLEEIFEGGTTTTGVDLGVDLGTYGNAYLQRVHNRGRVVLARRLPAATMKKYGTQGFVQTIRDEYGTEKRIYFSPEEIVHLKPPCPMGHFYALPDWISASGMIELANAATEWNAKFFANGAMPEYALIVKGANLSEPQKQAAREFFRREFRGIDNAHKTLFLAFDNKETEVEFQRVTAEMKDGDFLKMLDATRDRIHLAHGVPPRLLGIVTGGQLGGSGEITGQLKIFEDLRLAAIRRRAKSQLSPTLARMGVDPNSVRHRPLDLTPPDTDRQNVKDWLEGKIIDRDEARRLIGVDTETALAKSGSGRIALLARLLAES